MMEKLKFRLVIGMLYAFSLLPGPSGSSSFGPPGDWCSSFSPLFPGE